MAQYYAFNGPMQTTAAFADVATGTSIKTLLQIATPSNCPLRMRAWGIAFNGSSVATPIKVELIDTNVAATVTAHVAAGVQPYDSEAGVVASQMTLGVSATGYTASAEGSITNVRIGDQQWVAPSAGYSYEWALGKEFLVPVSRFLRVRVHAPATVQAMTWVRWEE